MTGRAIGFIFWRSTLFKSVLEVDVTDLKGPAVGLGLIVIGQVAECAIIMD